MKKVLPPVALIAAAIASASPVMAQDADKNARSLEEVVVTATRRETSLSDTPVSITALGGDNLIKEGVTDVFGMADSVPNIAIAQIDGGLNVTIRGVTSSDSTEKGDPSVNFMLDDVVIARPQAQGTSFYDVARVEVLRGPQGTLFGRNTTGGAINVITNKPNTEAVEGRVDASVGTYNSRNVTGVVNVPVNDNVAVRAAVNYDKQDNYLQGGALALGNLEEFKDNLSFRLSGLYQWETGELNVSFDKSTIDGSRQNFLPVESFYDVLDADGAFTVGSDAPARFSVDESVFDVNYNVAFAPTQNNETDGVRVAFTQSLDMFDVNYIGSSRDFSSAVLEARPVSGSDITYRYDFGGEFTQESHELRLSSNDDGALEWQVGYFTFSEESVNYLTINFAPNGAAGAPGLGFFQGPTTSDSSGLFGQATYSLNDTTRLTLGARYSEDEKSQRGYTVADFAPGGFERLARPTDDTPYNNVLDYKSDETTWKVGIDHDLSEETMVYANVSKGYKAGGFNGGCEIGTGDPALCTFTRDVMYYNPETIISYEAGAKAFMFDNTLKFDAVAFVYDYSDLQVTSIIEYLPGQTGAFTSNAASSTIKGFELDSQYLASANDEFVFTVTYLDSQYDEFMPNPSVDLSGNALSKTPKWTFTAGYTHTIMLADGATIDAGIKTKVSDSFTMFNGAFNNFWVQPGYSKTSLNVGYTSADDSWYANAFVKNLENSIVVSTINATGSARRYVQAEAPRTAGVSVGYKF